MYKYWNRTLNIRNLLSRHVNTTRNNQSNGKYYPYSYLGVIILASSNTIENQCENKNESDEFDSECGVCYETNQSFQNWSNTHSCHDIKVYEPKSTQEVSRVLKLFHNKRQKLRPIGTALSPNGIGLTSLNMSENMMDITNKDNSGCLLSLAAIDHVNVDEKNKLVTVGAGVKVYTILKELKKYNLTLENFSSIQEQQIGGWTQVSAHGTGISLSTVDDMIVNMTLAIPTGGILPLSSDNNSYIFNLAKVGLGNVSLPIY